MTVGSPRCAARCRASRRARDRRRPPGLGLSCDPIFHPAARGCEQHHRFGSGGPDRGRPGGRELLDAAVALLRGHAALFIGAGAVLATLEQLALYRPRSAAGLVAPFYLPYWDRLGEYWLQLATGLATEAIVIALLGSLTAGAAVPALLGERVRARDLVRGGRYGAVAIVALVAGVVVGVS